MTKKVYPYNNLVFRGAIVALAGYFLSGPVASILVRQISPQPEWVSSEVFSQNYHVIQDTPYYFGFLLISGMLMIAVGHYLNFNGSNDTKGKFMLLLALCFSIVFCALISFNYICQTTFVRNLAIAYRPEYDPAIATFSMANTRSLAWAIEMWGYAFLGIATALSAGYYRSNNILLAVLMILNGVASFAGAVFTIAYASWVMTTGGLVAYIGWNILMITIMVLILRESAILTAKTHMTR
jgi:hypothetical protein